MEGQKKISEMKEELQAAEEAMLPSFISRYEKDERAGARKLVQQARKGRRQKAGAAGAKADRTIGKRTAENREAENLRTAI